MLVNVLSLKDDDLSDEGDEKIKPGSGTCTYVYMYNPGSDTCIHEHPGSDPDLS